MFSFFTKKTYLVDHLDGFVDIHNHILPGIDDGAKTMEESIELIKAFGEFGVRDFIHTPHIMHNYYDNTPKTIKKTYKKVKKALKERDMNNISIDYAAEHMIDDNFENILENDGVLSLGDNHLLIEMSYLQPSINFDVSINKIKEFGLFPILAHPERYRFLYGNFQKYGSFNKKNILFQVNILSLGGYYGTETKKMALKLLDHKLLSYIGSDVHNMNQLKFLKECTITEKVFKKLFPVIQNTITNFS